MVQPVEVQPPHGLGSPLHDPMGVGMHHEPVDAGLASPQHHPARHVDLVLDGHRTRRGNRTPDVGARTRVYHEAHRPTGRDGGLFQMDHGR